jgi:anthranilate phosphoribosyltransferase
MALLGIQHALVVHGDSGPAGPGPAGAGPAGAGPAGPGLDELALSGPSHIAEVRNGVIQTYTLRPEDLGLARAPLSALAGGDAAHNAAILRAIFRGETGPHRDIILLNAAAVLLAAGLAPTLAEGIAQARTAIDSGSVQTLTQRLAAP